MHYSLQVLRNWYICFSFVSVIMHLKNTIVIEVADDNSLTVEPYDPEEMEVETVDVKVAHPGDNAYALYNNRLDPTTTTFCVCYKYRLKTGSWTEVREAIRLPVIVIE